MGAADRVIAKIAMPILILAGAVIVLAIIVNSNSRTNENNAYIRVINCIISIPATDRTQNDIEECYVQVEKDQNIKLRRYDSSVDQ